MLLTGYDHDPVANFCLNSHSVFPKAQPNAQETGQPPSIGKRIRKQQSLGWRGIRLTDPQLSFYSPTCRWIGLQLHHQYRWSRGQEAALQPNQNHCHPNDFQTACCTE
ncbi:uncharacterized protein LOC117582146 [Drosophila guanche]|uniref:uncharacterized protein LOC117582146 n=1 Tax=Drosophila guanche TaxID=7266 RepID=UPI001470AA86|nr:uncharacterized protein LOC117582146 [Drosophila guanche]